MHAGNGASGWKSPAVIGTGFGGFSKVFNAGTRVPTPSRSHGAEV
jgi:hypothetical protein